MSETLEQEVRAVRAFSQIPVCVGFGISTPEHASRVAAFADGVVVGSALVQRIEDAASREDAVSAASAFVTTLKKPLRSAS
jgi:tryptophan synthase alpha chain